jgi:hypothetical protein
MKPSVRAWPSSSPMLSIAFLSMRFMLLTDSESFVNLALNPLPPRFTTPHWSWILPTAWPCNLDPILTGHSSIWPAKGNGTGLAYFCTSAVMRFMLAIGAVHAWDFWLSLVLLLLGFSPPLGRFQTKQNPQSVQCVPPRPPHSPPSSLLSTPLPKQDGSFPLCARLLASQGLLTWKPYLPLWAARTQNRQLHSHMKLASSAFPAMGLGLTPSDSNSNPKAMALALKTAPANSLSDQARKEQTHD